MKEKKTHTNEILKFYVVNIYDARGLSNTTHACLLEIQFFENWIEDEKKNQK